MPAWGNMSNWLDEMFASKKPVIAMLHLTALPGDPGFDSRTGLNAVIERAKEELDALQDGGVDGIMRLGHRQAADAPNGHHYGLNDDPP